MTKRSLTILIVALVLIAGATVAIASSVGGSGNGAQHMMPGGGMMTGETMSGTHRMPSGEAMDGTEMDGMGMER